MNAYGLYFIVNVLGYNYLLYVFYSGTIIIPYIESFQVNKLSELFPFASMFTIDNRVGLFLKFFQTKS